VGRAQHDAHGHWIREAGAPPVLAPLDGAADADVVVIGGGYLGLWTAWHVLERAPAARVVVLEADRCGFGPSGRNGGFVNGLWDKAGSVAESAGDDAAVALAHAADASVHAIGAWCASHRIDAWYTPAPHLIVSAAPAQDGAWARGVAGARRLGAPEAFVPLTPDEVAARCRSPLFRAGALLPTAATVQPARLAFGLRERLLARGARIHERSRVRRLEGGDPVVAHTDRGRVRARSGVVAVNHATAGLAPFRRSLSVASSHIVLTEPVPDVLEAIGWTGGEAISDSRTMLHYLRTTPEGRIAFGWGGGRMAMGARRHRHVDVDPEVVRRTAADLVAFFPALGGRRVTDAWGGPIDVSPSHIPQIGTLPGAPVHYAFGYTGNGVGPSHLAGRTLAALAAGLDDPVTRLPIVGSHPVAWVPPEPIAWLGGSLVRSALLRRERIEEEGGQADPLTRALCAAPRALGIHLAR
jgi:glycine/D-amino acid oxidase-like deaminating enzyme